MDKYTKTINALKKEYINLKLSNTHSKFSNNKLMNGGYDQIGGSFEDIFSAGKSAKVELDNIHDYIENFYYRHNLVSSPEDNSYVIMGSMIFNDKNFIT